MLPIQIERRFAHPKRLQKEFLNYLKESNAPINQSKSIASNILYHAKDISLQKNISFFTGTYISTDTNIVGNFVRPESEHFLVYGIRCYVASAPTTVVSEQQWSRGIANAPAGLLANSFLSISVNSVRLLKNTPLTEFETSITTKDRGTMFLDEPILWQGQTELKMDLQNNSGIPYEADTFIRFDLVGIGLI